MVVIIKQACKNMQIIDDFLINHTHHTSRIHDDGLLLYLATTWYQFLLLPIILMVLFYLVESLFYKPMLFLFAIITQLQGLYFKGM